VGWDDPLKEERLWIVPAESGGGSTLRMDWLALKELSISECPLFNPLWNQGQTPAIRLIRLILSIRG
jgi:hypothetical protein